ncbi:hypothetical protein CEUSTIGMA_g6056.t1 [Chlamydomonas eustigma]|uniref:Uncharacterized protein n=1 Tax=Chlamydomonas eustigma TaxID=1157962 RepID=A0A250X6C1_9CHLO|nr:hypothetical protein CEUSTIGMA_g6056.t1 [Chlamydomonas eustigma]|eukprot:GAX78617.1 hypothetical protein CEUSTIGMA_g6056.t1 [Chlamydomonas eustigma]
MATFVLEKSREQASSLPSNLLLDIDELGDKRASTSESDNAHLAALMSGGDEFPLTAITASSLELAVNVIDSKTRLRSMSLGGFAAPCEITANGAHRKPPNCPSVSNVVRLYESRQSSSLQEKCNPPAINSEDSLAHHKSCSSSSSPCLVVGGWNMRPANKDTITHDQKSPGFRPCIPNKSSLHHMSGKGSSNNKPQTSQSVLLPSFKDRVPAPSTQLHYPQKTSLPSLYFHRQGHAFSRIVDRSASLYRKRNEHGLLLTSQTRRSLDSALRPSSQLPPADYSPADNLKVEQQLSALRPSFSLTPPSVLMKKSSMAMEKCGSTEETEGTKVLARKDDKSSGSFQRLMHLLHRHRNGPISTSAKDAWSKVEQESAAASEC